MVNKTDHQAALYRIIELEKKSGRTYRKDISIRESWHHIWPATSNFSWNLTKANKPSVSNNGENQNQLDLINGIALENKEREKKKKNLIIFGANESNDIENNNNSEKDGEQVKNIFTIIDIDFEKVKTIKRFNKPRRGSNFLKITIGYHIF